MDIFAKQGVQKLEIALFSCKIMGYMDMIKILGLQKSFAFVMQSICEAFSQIDRTGLYEAILAIQCVQ